MTGFVVEVSAAAERVALPHRCPDGADAPVEVSVGPGARQRLADGEAFPATGRCRRCGGRAFGSLVDPDARAARRAAARPDPSALRRPTLPPNVRRFPVDRVRPKPNADPCPACGVVPDSLGVCRCSL
ncbi:MAG TPA: hypothetical protein VFC93_11930 [Chloroflexota bacterium]|nr:hypothetical protein [Chloroflexota bacterium]